MTLPRALTVLALAAALPIRGALWLADVVMSRADTTVCRMANELSWDEEEE